MAKKRNPEQRKTYLILLSFLVLVVFISLNNQGPSGEAVYAGGAFSEILTLPCDGSMLDLVEDFNKVAGCGHCADAALGRPFSSPDGTYEYRVTFDAKTCTSQQIADFNAACPHSTMC